MKSVVFWKTRCLCILFLAVISSVRANPERWTAELAAFAHQDGFAAGRSDVLFVGSSSIRLWSSLERDFPEFACVNRGFGGSCLADVVAHFDVLVGRHRPSVVVLYAGENDLAEGRRPEAVEADFETFRGLLRASVPQAHLVYVSIKPSPCREFLRAEMERTNALIAARCAGAADCTFVDLRASMLDEQGRVRSDLFSDDGLHMNAHGYELWTKTLTPVLDRVYRAAHGSRMASMP